MKNIFPACGCFLLTAFFVCSLWAASAEEEKPLSYLLGLELLQENSPELAAVEFRRQALASTNDNAIAASYLFAGYSYLQANKFSQSEEMLSRAEGADMDGDDALSIMFLNAESARVRGDLDSALYYFEWLAETKEKPLQVYAQRQSAALHLKDGHVEKAKAIMQEQQPREEERIKAIDAYAMGRDKSPKLGGLLGIIPGCGYFYSGEYANGFRSIILNALFMYGMAHTAENDQWGAFGIITFFEVTWYTGSIYGGVDAAHRYNQQRRNDSMEAITDGLNYSPRFDFNVTIPIFKLNIEF